MIVWTLYTLSPGSLGKRRKVAKAGESLSGDFASLPNNGLIVFAAVVSSGLGRRPQFLLGLGLLTGTLAVQ